MKKLLAFVSSANQFFVFIAMLLIILLASENWISKILRNTYEKPKVEVVENTDGGKSSIEMTYEKNFERQIMDVYVFSLSSDSIIIEPEQATDDRVLNFFSGPRKPERQKVNLLFVPKSGPSYLLIKNDVYISRISYYEKPSKGSFNRTMLSKNIYLIIDKDTNGDGFLDQEGDVVNLYVSDYNGNNITLVLKDVDNYRVEGDDSLIIEVSIEGKSSFYSYDVAENKLSRLDTETPLTNPAGYSHLKR